MTATKLLHALAQLRHLEDDAKEGDLDREQLADKLGFDDPDKAACAKGTGMALLHLPLKGSMDLAWMAVTPVITAFLIVYDFTFAAFLLFILARLAIWAYDSALIYHGQHSDAAPYNSSTLSTLMGTFPYRGNWLVGPGLIVLLDIGFVLPFSGVLGLSQLGLAGSAIEAGAVAHALLSLVTRVALNTACAIEQHGGFDRSVTRASRRGVEAVANVLAQIKRTADRAARLPGFSKRPEALDSGPPPDPVRRKAHHFARTNPQRLDAG